MKLPAALLKILPPIVVVLLLCSGGMAVAAPALTEVSPRGLQAGGTTTLTFVGSELGAQSRVVLPFSVAKQAVKPGAQANQVQIEVSLDKSTPAGVYHLRLASEDGVSNPLAIGVDELPQQPLGPEVSSMPVALNGSLTGGTILQTRFTGKAGQRVVIDLESRRLGGGLNPVLEIHRPDGVLLAYSPSQELLGGDARLDVALPADGAYTVKLYDALYRGAAPGHFRLKIGQFQYADVLLPLGVQRGTQATLTAVVTNLAAGTKWTMQSDSLFGLEPATWPAGVFSGGRARLIVSDVPEVVETPAAAGGLQEVTAPVGVSGQLAEAGQVDRYLVRVKPGMRLRFDVLADRIGSPMDAVLSIQQVKGGQLAAADDGESTTDPTLDFTVPGGVEAVAAAIHDQAGQGGPRGVYRLGITEIKPDFSLTALADRVHVPQGGVAMVRVRAVRDGYTGPIKLSFPGGLPPGVSIVGSDTIPTGGTDALLALRGRGCGGRGRRPDDRPGPGRCGRHLSPGDGDRHAHRALPAVDAARIADCRQSSGAAPSRLGRRRRRAAGARGHAAGGGEGHPRHRCDGPGAAIACHQPGGAASDGRRPHQGQGRYRADAADRKPRRGAAGPGPRRAAARGAAGAAADRV